MTACSQGWLQASAQPAQRVNLAMSKRKDKTNERNDDLWFVLYCEDDDSHVVCDHTSVICDEYESVKTEERVSFKYPGVKHLMEGTVKGMSTSVKEMYKLQDELNKLTKPKRNTSFDATKKRKSALKCLDSVSTLSGRSGRSAKNPVPTSKSTGSRNSSKTNTPKILDESSTSKVPTSFGVKPSQKISISSESESESDNSSKPVINDVNITDKDDDSSSDEELTEIEKKILDKVMKKKKVQDFKSLAALFKTDPLSCGSKVGSQKSEGLDTSSNNDFSFSDHNSEFVEEPVQKSQKDPEKGPEKNLEEDLEKIPEKGPEEKKNNSSDDGTTNVQSSKKKRQRLDVPAPVEYSGEFFIHKVLDVKNLKELKLKQLHPDHAVFVSEKDLSLVKKKCHTASATARMLLRYVFTPESRAVCSVGGFPYQDRKSGQLKRRPPLHSDGVSAILDFALSRAEKKGWAKPPESSLKQSMNSQLTDGRAP